MKYWKPILVVIVIIVVLVLGKIFFFPSPNAQKDSKKSSGPPPPVAVVGYQVKGESLDNNVLSTGSLLANEIVDISPEVAGKLIFLKISEGQIAQQGQLLAKVNDADLQAQLKKLKVQLEIAQNRVDRSQKLLDINGLSVEEYEDALNQLNILKADIEYTKTLIAKTEIKAPFTGRLGFKNMSDGAFVNTSSVITTLQQIHPIKLEFSIPERYASQVKVGSQVQFNIDGYTQLFEAQVYAIEPNVDIASRSIVLRAKANNSGNLLKPGAFARVQLNLGTDDQAIMIPSQSILPVLKGQQVLLAKNGEVVAQPITLGYRGAQKVQVLEGVSIGDTVITTGVMSLKPGAKVVIKSMLE